MFSPETGLLSGDVIHNKNAISVDSVEAIRGRLRDIKSGSPVVLQVERDNKAFDTE